MLSDYITREEALDCLTGHVPETVEEFVARTIKRIKNLPPADVRPVVYGHWIDEGQYADYSNAHAFRCSICGNHLLDYPGELKYRKYCQNCGAEMKDSENHGTITREKLRSMSAAEINREWDKIQKALKGDTNVPLP